MLLPMKSSAFFIWWEYNCLLFSGWIKFNIQIHYALLLWVQKDLVIYEMNVRAFTIDESSGLDNNICGSYLGVIEKVTSVLWCNTICISIDFINSISLWNIKCLSIIILNKAYSQISARLTKLTVLVPTKVQLLKYRQQRKNVCDENGDLNIRMM